MRAEIDVRNERGNHITASVIIEGETDTARCQLVVTDFLASLSSRLENYKDAQESATFVILEGKDE